jgi:hypothetical protein
LSGEELCGYAVQVFGGGERRAENVEQFSARVLGDGDKSETNIVLAVAADAAGDLLRGDREFDSGYNDSENDGLPFGNGDGLPADDAATVA